MNLENFKPEQSEERSLLEKIAGKCEEVIDNLSSLDEPVESPYSSGFDKDHPMPTYSQLRDAGFSDHLANQILYGTHSYSDKELFQALYSPHPVDAYNRMVEAKAEQMMKRLDDRLNSCLE